MTTGTTHDRRTGLDALFGARNVVVIGASDNPRKLAGRPLAYLRQFGFSGGIHPVNPARRTVQGLPSHASVSALVSDLGVVPDVAILVVPAAGALAAVEECAAVGVPVAVVMSAGFAESGRDGEKVQHRMTEVAEAAGMRLLGPNCLGAFNSATGLCASFSAAFVRGLPAPGPVGIVSQSGAYGSHVVHLVGRRGIGVQYWITTGNEADIDVAEAVEWMARRPEVEVLLVYVEGVRDGERFLEALRVAHECGTRVVLLKSGSSAAGERAASAHTGAFTGSDAVFDQVLRQYGVYRARTVEEQIDVVYAAVCGGSVARNRLAIVTMSGGVGAQLCDSAATYGLEVPLLPESAQRQVRELLPYATVSNPVDCTAQVLQDMRVLRGSLEVILSGHGYDALIAFFSTTLLNPDTAAEVFDAVHTAMQQRSDELVVICMVAPDETVARFERAGCLVFEDPDRAVRAVAALVELDRASRRPGRPARSWSPPDRVLSGAQDERAATRELARAGVPVQESRVAPTEEQAWQAAQELGLPAVVKVLSADVVHKTEVGGVALDLRSETDVRTAFRDVTGAVRRARPDARVDGVVVSRMAPPGVELIIGLTRDPVFGAVVVLGLGGVFVEVLGDTVIRLAPVDEAEATAMVDELRGRALLRGNRGTPAADVGAVAAAVAAVSRFGHLHREVLAVEVNPFVVWPVGGAALDGVLEISSTEEQGAQR